MKSYKVTKNNETGRFEVINARTGALQSTWADLVTARQVAIKLMSGRAV